LPITLELGRGGCGVRLVGVGYLRWTPRDDVYRLFAIGALSFCNVYMAFGIGTFLFPGKTVPKMTAFLLHFHFAVIFLAIFWLIAGLLAFVFQKRALVYVHVLVVIQLAITVYAILSPIYLQ
jgi:hypothetical protein